MKKILSTVAITATLSTSAIAADFIQGGYYGGAGIGFEDYSTYSYIDPGMTLVLNGGKPIIKLGPGTIGAEAEFTYTLIPLTYDTNSDWELTIMTLGGYATYTFDHSDKLYSRVKLGIVHRDYSWDYDNSSSWHSDYNEVGVAAGIGAGYKLNSLMRVYSDLIVLDGTDLKQLNFGVQIGF
jgi:opacity protein-like surface antigen